VLRSGKAGKGNPYLKGALGEAAAAAAKSNTFLGERYRRIVTRRGKLKALVAVARSILVIVCNLLKDPRARFHDLGVDFHATRANMNAEPATTSPNWLPWATASPPNPPPDTATVTKRRQLSGSQNLTGVQGSFTVPVTLSHFPVSPIGSRLRVSTLVGRAMTKWPSGLFTTPDSGLCGAAGAGFASLSAGSAGAGSTGAGPASLSAATVRRICGGRDGGTDPVTLGRHHPSERAT